MSATIQTYIPNGVWIPIGINSIHENTVVAKNWENTQSPVITDIADDKSTYVGVDNNGYGYNLASGVTGSIDVTTNNTVFSDAVVSVFAIAKKRTLNSIVLSNHPSRAVHIKLLSVKKKNNLIMHDMYIEGLSDPVARIQYQADYEGEMFRIKFGADSLQDKTSFYTYFNNSNNYENPAKLYVSISQALEKGKSVLIRNAVDFNITDNNITAMQSGIFDIENDLRPYDADGDILVYRLEDGLWMTYNSRNNQLSSNDFNKFEVGGAYWIKATSNLANLDNNFTKIGLITDSVGTITQDIYENMSSGWNMATFSSDYVYKAPNNAGLFKYTSVLKYAPTSMFIPENILNTVGVNLFFYPFSSNVSIIDQNISLFISPTSRYQSVVDVAQGINIAVFARNKFFNESLKMRAFPAMSRAGASGVAVISDHTFEVNTSDVSIVSLSGQGLAQTSTNGASTIYGDYFIASELVPLSGIDINASMTVNFHLVSKDATKITDLNTTSNISKINRIYDGLVSASVDKKGVSNIFSDVFLVDFDFNSSKNYRNESDFDSIFIGASEKMNIRDVTYIKIFQYVTSSTFEIVGKQNKTITPIIESNMTRLINYINANYATTGVRATSLNTTSSNYFMISSSEVDSLSKIDLRETFLNLFNPFISLSSTLLPDKSPVKGALGEIYTHVNILNSTLSLETDILYGENTNIADYSNVNLMSVNGDDTNGSIEFLRFTNSAFSYSKIYAPSFSNSAYSFPAIFTDVGKKITTILTQEISASGKAYWEISDLTKAPQDWLGKRDYSKIPHNDFDKQFLLNIKENKAYWVKLEDVFRPKTNYLGHNNTLEIKKAFTYYFNNTINANGELKTQNHIFHKVYISFSNKDFSDYMQRDYNVNAKLNSTHNYNFDITDKGFELLISDTYMPLSDGVNGFEVRSLNEVGENFLGQSKIINIDFKKPQIPLVSWSNEKLQVNNLLPNYKPQVYLEHISEIPSVRKKYQLIYPLLGKNKTLQWNSGEDEHQYGNVKKLIVIIDADKLYSNGKAILYAPLREGHILSIDKNTTLSYVKNPYSLKSKKIIPTVGISLARLGYFDKNNDNMKLLYYPKDIRAYLSSFFIPRVIYIKKKGMTESIASITYSQYYENNIFYFQYNNKLYQGRFGNSARKVYDLDDLQVINIYNYKTKKSSYNHSYLLKLDYNPTISNSQSIILK